MDHSTFPNKSLVSSQKADVSGCLLYIVTSELTGHVWNTHTFPNRSELDLCAKAFDFLLAMAKIQRKLNFQQM